jgi:hypothetical protein
VIVISTAELQQALQDHLPHEDYERIGLLAYLIASLTNSGETDTITTSPEFNSILRKLAGKHISTSKGTISFGEGSQIGDITLRDVADKIVNVVINIDNVDTTVADQVTVLIRPREAVEYELEDLIVRGRALRDATAARTKGTSVGDFITWSKDWHFWRRQAEQVLARSFSTSVPLNYLRMLHPTHLDFSRPLQDRDIALANDVVRDLAFLEDIHSRLSVYV